jgi:hypothetical protein
MGVMINMLFGDGETQEAMTKAIGHTISGVKLENDEILVGLNNGSTLRVSDQGQSCCESRYITTDADLPSYVGRRIVGFELRDMPDVNDSSEHHEVQAFVIRTDEGNIDFVTHVEHNGYYGGFSISASLSEYNVAHVPEA